MARDRHPRVVFGRPRNLWPGGTTLGNQLTTLTERSLGERPNACYPGAPYQHPEGAPPLVDK